MTMTCPQHNRLATTRLGIILMALLFMIPAIGLIPDKAVAQTSSSAPALGKTVQGQTAATPENAVNKAVSYLGNVICPLVAVAFFVQAVFNYRSGKNIVGPAVTGVGLLAVSGIIRYAETLVSQ